MTASTIVALISGIVTATCAIAGAIAGIRARRAREAQEEKMRMAENNARVQNTVNNRNSIFTQATPVQMSSNTTSNTEIHCYHHNVDNVQHNPMYSYPIPLTCSHGQNGYYQNPYMNSGYGGYSTGYVACAPQNTYVDDPWPTERLIGEMSKRNMYMRQHPSYQPQISYNTYYPQSVPYAYAS